MTSLVQYRTGLSVWTSWWIPFPPDKGAITPPAPRATESGAGAVSISQSNSGPRVESAGPVVIRSAPGYPGSPRVWRVQNLSTGKASGSMLQHAPWRQSDFPCRHSRSRLSFSHSISSPHQSESALSEQLVGAIRICRRTSRTSPIAWLEGGKAVEFAVG